ncbi:hypothetical protein BCV71DRAFT_276999 [Rhizopus microsporus]|uniref:Uncharacterized protein n=2 Tax=Rhizopus microsporus TaxID=58291 RepID=A0A1X0RPM6_RHIZD|nr:hypothetical protein BCV71DRAFT_276999 [Rhizopus microsporus]
MILKDSLVQDAYDEILEAGTSHNENNSNGEEQQPEPKKRKYLKAADFKDVNWGNKVTMLNENFGTNGVLDLTRTAIIPKRLRIVVDGICQHYRLSLPMTLKNEEYKFLNIISNCRTKKSLYQSVEKIDPFCNDSELPYIKLAVQKLCNLWHRGVLTGDHNEDWYRVNVYGDLFDFIFNGQVGYETKRRSECHSLIVKSLRKMGFIDAETKNIRLDFIFTNNGGLNDAFYCEDKPNERALKDSEKTRRLREQALNYWVSLLPYDECIEHITVVTCQFNKLKLQITATKFIAGATVHSALKEVRIPNNNQEGASVAEYLATIISLVRMIIRNFEIIKLMTDIAKEDNLVFLSSSLTPDMCYREDTPYSSQSSSSSSASSQEWLAQERKARIMQKIDDAIATFDDNGEYLDYSWEDIVFSQLFIVYHLHSSFYL